MGMPLSVLEQVGMAFDPGTQDLGLTKEEKRRATALLMAITAYDGLIVKNAEAYIAISKDRGIKDGPKIDQSTIDAIVAAATRFEVFIKGHQAAEAVEA